MSPRRSSHRHLAVLLGVVAVAACAGGGPATGEPSREPGGTALASPTAPPAARTTPDVIAQQAALDGQAIAVRGFFTTDGTTHLVCDAILESYPPQCGGATIAVVGTIPPEALAMLESTREPDLAQVAWGNVEIRGTFHSAGGTARPTLDLSEMRVVP